MVKQITRHLNIYNGHAHSAGQENILLEVQLLAQIVLPTQIRPPEARQVLPVLATQVLLLRRMVDVRSNAAPATPAPTAARVRHAASAHTKRQLERRYAQIVLTIPFRPAQARQEPRVFAMLAIPDK